MTACRDRKVADLRNGHELLDGLEDVDEMPPEWTKNTKVRIPERQHGISKRIEAEIYFPDHPTR